MLFYTVKNMKKNEGTHNKGQKISEGKRRRDFRDKMQKDIESECFQMLTLL